MLLERFQGGALSDINLMCEIKDNPSRGIKLARRGEGQDIRAAVEYREYRGMRKVYLVQESSGWDGSHRPLALDFFSLLLRHESCWTAGEAGMAKVLASESGGTISLLVDRVISNQDILVLNFLLLFGPLYLVNSNNCS